MKKNSLNQQTIFIDTPPSLPIEMFDGNDWSELSTGSLASGDGTGLGLDVGQAGRHGKRQVQHL